MGKIIFVFSGPSGAGKSTLIQWVLKTFNNIKATVSCTTRSPRVGEIDGVHYNFISQKQFEEAINNNDFIEYVECYGNKYGTLKDSITQIFTDYDACILDIDFMGGYRILSGQILNEIRRIGILILPPSIKTLRNRLAGRRSESEESLNNRLNNSFRAEKIGKYEHIIINKDFAASKSELSKILKGYGL